MQNKKKSKVYLAPVKLNSESMSLLEKTEELFERAEFSKIVKKDKLVALKVHFGEVGGTAYLRAQFVRQIVEKVKSYQGKPFLTDANTLYLKGRANAVDHLNTAIYNGFSYSVVNAPLIIADGLTGKDYLEVAINKKHFKKVKISSGIYFADALISLSHFKGHVGVGFGGTLKNVGMGLASRAGKQMIHSQVKPEVNKDKCIGCGECAKWCPTKAIRIKGKKAVIGKNKCMGCGECTVTCENKAIAIRWDDNATFVQERMVEFCYAILKDKKERAGFMNFILDVTPECDCFPLSGLPIIPDVGILASLDPVALDQASLDLANQQLGDKKSALRKNYSPGKDKFRGLYPQIDSRRQLEYAEDLGLGRRSYQILEVR